MSLELDKAEWLNDILNGSSSLKAFLELWQGRVLVRWKVKGLLYKTFGKAIEFKHGVADARSRLLLFWSWTK